MKGLNSLILLASLAASSATIHADGGSSMASAAPTALFFNSLAACREGDYQERNLLVAKLGTQLLSHQIHGLNEEVCEVTLSTPDRRIMQCAFKPGDLTRLSDQTFLSGILNDTMEDPTSQSLQADQFWNDLKAHNCIFVDGDLDETKL